MTLVTSEIILRIIISINLITTLETAVCYILLLPACKVETRVKRKLFLQASDDFRIWVTPA